MCQYCVKAFAEEQLQNKPKNSKYSIIIGQTADCAVQKSCSIIKFFYALNSYVDL